MYNINVHVQYLCKCTCTILMYMYNIYVNVHKLLKNLIRKLTCPAQDSDNALMSLNLVPFFMFMKSTSS